MKRKLLVLFSLLSLVLIGTKPILKAETVTTTPEIITTVDVNNEGENIEENPTEEVVETSKISKAETWLEDNFGWIFGIPVGALITAILEILVISKKEKLKVEEIKVTKQSNELLSKGIEITNEMVEEAKKLLADTVEQVNCIAKSVDNLYGRLDHTDNYLQQVKGTFFNLQNNINNVNADIQKLNQVQLLIATHTRELVANTTAEEIVKIINNK